MTSLPLSEVPVPKTSIDLGLRAGWFKHIGLAIGGASGAAVVIGAYEVLRAQPEKAFALLQSWGPGFLLVLVALFIVGKFLDGLNSTVRESFSMVAAGVHSSAEASSRTADALTKLADQGSKSTEEVRRLAIYAAQEFPGIYERLDKQDDILKDVLHSVKGLHSMLDNEKAALEHREAEEAR